MPLLRVFRNCFFFLLIRVQLALLGLTLAPLYLIEVAGNQHHHHQNRHQRNRQIGAWSKLICVFSDEFVEPSHAMLPSNWRTRFAETSRDDGPQNSISSNGDSFH